MDLTFVATLVVVVLIIIAVLAFAFYKAGFTVDKVKAKLPMFEMEASRGKPASEEKTPPPTGAKIRQQAQAGGTITKSGITAPADSGADIDQQAKGEKSKIDDSPINLT